MSERLVSVGIDVGTTSTQLIVSELGIENRASAFAVPEMEITERKVLYESPVYFTPLQSEQLVDGQGVREIVTKEYETAGISREKVDTGAIIITGETSRKENARTVLDSLADFAGEFVVATAGPALESVLAAKGAGAVSYSQQTGKRVLHMDIGGGTSNLALIEDGNIIATGCLNVGGRLLKLDERGRVLHVSPEVEKLCKLRNGEAAPQEQVRELARLLASALEMAAGLRQRTELLDILWTKEHGQVWQIPGKAVISFSGGVADCIRQEVPWLRYGDMGPVLGKAIRESLLCRGEYRLGSETIRATVIGAGCHSARLSGSTVYYRDFRFPQKNIPVIAFQEAEQVPGVLRQKIRQRLGSAEAERNVLALPGWESPGYAQVVQLAEEISAGLQGAAALICTQGDMAKALGHALALRHHGEVLCIDRLRLTDGDYLDVGQPVGPAIPVVIKTLILNR